MKSKSTIKDFEVRLKELTTIEPDFWVVTPYHMNGKPFCGTFDSSTFKLTRNSFWSHTKQFSIRGTFRSLPDGSTEVEYEVGLTKSMKIFSIVVFIIVLVGSNVLMVSNGAYEKIENYLFNMFWVFALCFSLVVNKVTAAIVKERFKTEFQIID